MQERKEQSPLTLEELETERPGNGKSPGADGLHNEMLMHLEPTTKEGLLHVMAVDNLAYITTG